MKNDVILLAESFKIFFEKVLRVVNDPTGLVLQAWDKYKESLTAKDASPESVFNCARSLVIPPPLSSQQFSNCSSNSSNSSGEEAKAAGYQFTQFLTTTPAGQRKHGRSNSSAKTSVPPVSPHLIVTGTQSKEQENQQNQTQRLNIEEVQQIKGLGGFYQLRERDIKYEQLKDSNKKMLGQVKQCIEQYKTDTIGLDLLHNRSLQTQTILIEKNSTATNMNTMSGNGGGGSIFSSKREDSKYMRDLSMYSKKNSFININRDGCQTKQTNRQEFPTNLPSAYNSPSAANGYAYQSAQSLNSYSSPAVTTTFFGYNPSPQRGQGGVEGTTANQNQITIDFVKQKHPTANVNDFYMINNHIGYTGYQFPSVVEAAIVNAPVSQQTGSGSYEYAKAIPRKAEESAMSFAKQIQLLSGTTTSISAPTTTHERYQQNVVGGGASKQKIEKYFLPESDSFKVTAGATSAASTSIGNMSINSQNKSKIDVDDIVQRIMREQKEKDNDKTGIGSYTSSQNMFAGDQWQGQAQDNQSKQVSAQQLQQVQGYQPLYIAANRNPIPMGTTASYPSQQQQFTQLQTPQQKITIISRAGNHQTSPNASKKKHEGEVKSFPNFVFNNIPKK